MYVTRSGCSRATSRASSVDPSLDPSSTSSSSQCSYVCWKTLLIAADENSPASRKMRTTETSDCLKIERRGGGFGIAPGTHARIRLSVWTSDDDDGLAGGGPPELPGCR